MTLYHGSNQIVTVIDFAKSKPNKDFGKGFYLSANKQQALEMAEYKTFTNGGKPILNVYEFDEKQLDNPNLKVKRFEGYTKEWAEFVLPTATLQMVEVHMTMILSLVQLQMTVSDYRSDAI